MAADVRMIPFFLALTQLVFCRLQQALGANLPLSRLASSLAPSMTSTVSLYLQMYSTSAGELRFATLVVRGMLRQLCSFITTTNAADLDDH